MNTLKFGNGEWYGKKDTILAYNDENSNYKPLPFNFSRASKATVINKAGLIETVGSGIPRIDYLGNTKGALKLEPQRTNNLPYSEDFSIVNWSKYGSGTGVAPTVTSNYAISPDGTLNASRLQFNKGSGITSSDMSILNDNVAVTSGITTSKSVYVKSNTSEEYDIVVYGASDASGTNIKKVRVTSEWQRVEVYKAVPSTTSGITIGLREINVTGLSNTADVLVWGAQLEEGSYATSYIPTQGSAVTRLQDNIDTDFGTILPLSGEVSVYMEMLGQPVNGINSTKRITSVNFDDTNANNSSYVSLNFNSAYWRARVQGASGGSFVSFGVDQTETIKALFVLKPTSYAIYANGNLIGSETRSYNDTAPIISEIAKVEFDNATSDRGITRNKDLRVYNTALSNAEAIALTQV